MLNLIQNPVIILSGFRVHSTNQPFWVISAGRSKHGMTIGKKNQQLLHAANRHSDAPIDVERTRADIAATDVQVVADRG